jgi:hypothetical protein
MTVAVKPGTEYIALANLSVPRANRKADDPNDLVPVGGTVSLTDEQAAPFLNRRPPVIIPKNASREQMVRIQPRQLAGQMFTPPPPPADSDEPRPDPAGSSNLIVFDDPRVPELHEPAIDSEQRPAGGVLDLAPTGSAEQAAAALAAAAGRRRR